MVNFQAGISCKKYYSYYCLRVLDKNATVRSKQECLWPLGNIKGNNTYKNSEELFIYTANQNIPNELYLSYLAHRRKR